MNYWNCSFLKKKSHWENKYDENEDLRNKKETLLVQLLWNKSLLQCTHARSHVFWCLQSKKTNENEDFYAWMTNTSSFPHLFSIQKIRNSKRSRNGLKPTLWTTICSLVAVWESSSKITWSSSGHSCMAVFVSVCFLGLQKAWDLGAMQNAFVSE